MVDSICGFVIMVWCDFRIKYDPSVDTKSDLARRVLYALIAKRLKGRKPAVIFLCGGSGEGKSYSAMAVQKVLLEFEGLQLKEYLNHINVYVPVQYPEKLKSLLWEKDLKGVKVICVHEARDLIKAKMWNSFVAQAIADVNAQSRSIKRMCVMIVSQSLKDITNEMRHTLNYYVKVSRPIGKKARLYWQVVWDDDRDMEKPRLRKRRLYGQLVYPDGRHRPFSPKYIEVGMPDRDVIEEFEKNDVKAKSQILKHKLSKLVKEMRGDLELGDVKVDSMVEFYSKHPDSLSLIGKWWGKKWRVKPQVKEMHDLTVDEVKLFQDKLNEKLKEVGQIES